MTNVFVYTFGTNKQTENGATSENLQPSHAGTVGAEHLALAGYDDPWLMWRLILAQRVHDLRRQR